MGRVRYAKSETGTLRGRGATMEQRWSDAGVDDRRVHLSQNSFILPEDLAYITAMAEERGESRSRVVEMLIWRWYSRGLYRYLLWYPAIQKRLPRSTPAVRMPKFTVHPVTLEMFRKIAKSQGLPDSATLHLILRLHRVSLGTPFLISVKNF